MLCLFSELAAGVTWWEWMLCDSADEAADTDTVAACPDTSEVSPSDDKLVAVADTEDDLSLGAEGLWLCIFT